MQKQIFLVIFITCLINNSYSVAAQAPAPTNVYLLGGFSKQKLQSLRVDAVNKLEENQEQQSGQPGWAKFLFNRKITIQKERIALVDDALKLYIKNYQ